MIDIESAKNYIVQHAQACYPYEACGLIVAKGNKQEVICGRNIAEYPRHTFMLHPDDYAHAEDTGEILAVYHSHCNEAVTVTPMDKTLAEKHNIPLIIVGLPDIQWATYKPCGWKAELVGRPFVYGVLDCLTLVQDYYREKHGITIRDFAYVADWWNKGEDLYTDNLPKEGFVRIDTGIQESDLILMALQSHVANHCAIYTGGGIMLHHPPGHLSGYHPYTTEQGYYAKNTVGIWRHEKLIHRPYLENEIGLGTTP